MTTTAPGDLATRLRRRLADELQAGGYLRSEPRRRAVERVPREMFLGDQVYRRADTPQGTLWEPLTQAGLSPTAWIELAYQDATWVTQLDGASYGRGIIQGAPTSSSTLPGLVVRMLEDLDVRDEHNVLEVGTGSGYSTALLCERLGDSHVTAIEVGTDVAAKARAALTSAGYAPALFTGDGLGGCADRGPFDRIIATCSVRSVPRPWLAQATPGTRILTPMLSWLCGAGLLALEVTGTGTAHGHFLPGTVSFMPARPHAAPPLTRFPPREGESRAAVHGAGLLDDWMGCFLAGLAAPWAQHARLLGNETPAADVVVDQASHSYAWLGRESTDWTVCQHGPARLWDQIEHAYDTWRHVGQPPQEKFTLQITPRAQTVHLDAQSWALPAT
jgi:methyltransferase of ATP-grasp peptide maturase system